MTKQYLNKSFKEQDLKDILNLPSELDDFKEVLLQAARSGKYEPNDWLLPEGKKQDKKTQYNSIMHHITDALRGVTKDRDSGLDPRLHAACRLMMDYTRDRRGAIHSLDSIQGKLASSRRSESQKRLDSELLTRHEGERAQLVRSGTENSHTTYYIGDQQVSRDLYYRERRHLNYGGTCE